MFEDILSHPDIFVVLNFYIASRCQAVTLLLLCIMYNIPQFSTNFRALYLTEFLMDFGPIFCQIHLENGSDQGFEFHHHHHHHHHSQTSLTSLCIVTLNVYSLYTNSDRLQKT